MVWSGVCYGLGKYILLLRGFGVLILLLVVPGWMTFLVVYSVCNLYRFPVICQCRYLVAFVEFCHSDIIYTITWLYTEEGK